MRLSPGPVFYSWPSGKVNLAEQIIIFPHRVKICLSSFVMKFHLLINDNEILLAKKSDLRV
jgi:hypothetical protein